MSMFAVLFYVFALLAVTSAVVVAFSRSVIYAAFALLFTFLGVAGIYVLLMADFIAVAQVMVYVGGILILIIFGVMLTNRVTDVDLQSGTMQGIPATIVAGILLGTLCLLMTRTQWLTAETQPAVAGTTADLGTLLLTSYVLPFETAGVLLLITIMGAAMIARRDDHRKELP
jgi:NADH-quinone oxidoreductase subunit J